MENRNIYKGNRYVPKIMGEWNQEETYEGLSIVTNKGTSYTSKKRVPVGIDILDEEYWVVTGNYNAQVENYRQEVREFDNRINDNQSDIEETNIQLEKRVTYPILENEQGVVREDIPYGDVTRYGAISETDSTEAITNAIAFCNASKTTLHFPKGRFLDSQERVLTTSVSGVGLRNSEWVYTENTGQHLTFDSIYIEYLTVADIKITHENRTNNASGVHVVRDPNNSKWGGSLRMYRSKISFYGNTVLHLTDAYNCLFEDCNFEGVDTSTILFNESKNSISNVNNFEKCVFLVGRIGIKLYNIVDMHCSNCTFENFDLFLNAENDSQWPKITFKHSHFENFRKGIINAKMNEDTLETVMPIENKFDLTRMVFSDNITNVPADHVDKDINPEVFSPKKKYYFYFTDGLAMDGSGRYYYPAHGWVFKTEQGMFINAVSKRVFYKSDSVLEGTWTIRDDFGNAPYIYATINELEFYIENDYKLSALLSPTVKVDGTTVTVTIRKLPSAPAFNEDDNVVVNLMAISNWK